MRILTGQFKGKYLSAGQDTSIRPITNRIKEIVFSVIGEIGTDIWILDLFSGSGSLGLEALSRGAKGVTFVEKSSTSINVLNSNIKKLDVNLEKVKIIKSDVLEYLQQTKSSFKIILADPPFKYPEMQKLIEIICDYKILHYNGVLMLHHEIDNAIASYSEKYQILKQKKVGRSLLSFIVQEGENV